MAMFKVATHTGADNQGWIGYNEETKEITVCLQDEALKKAAYEYLSTPKVLKRFTGLTEFEEVSGMPNDSLDMFKLALGKIWEATTVYIDWSRPVE